MIEFKPRYFLPPAIALTVLAMLHAPADGGRAAQGGCSVQIRDPGIRASFEALRRAQSGAAVKACAIASNTLPSFFRQSDNRKQGTDRCVSW